MPRACSSPRTRRRTSREPSSSSTADIWRSERCASRRTSRGWGPAVRGEPIRDGMADEASFDRAKAKAFTMLMVRHLEGAAVSIMLEVGRRVGLFEAMAKMGPATSEVVAETAGLNERYVREWLAAMVCGGIVEYTAAEHTYRLPREHAAGLTGSSTRNLTSMVEMFPLMNRVIPEVARAFRTGGGVPYSAYPPDFTGPIDPGTRPGFVGL